MYYFKLRQGSSVLIWKVGTAWLSSFPSALSIPASCPLHLVSNTLKRQGTGMLNISISSFTWKGQKGHKEKEDIFRRGIKLQLGLKKYPTVFLLIPNLSSSKVQWNANRGNHNHFIFHFISFFRHEVETITPFSTEKSQISHNNFMSKHIPLCEICYKLQVKIV